MDQPAVQASGLASTQDIGARRLTVKLIAAVDALSTAALALACLALVGICGLMLIEIFSRWTVGRGWKMTWDVASYLLGAMFFLGAPYTLRTNGHIRVGVAYGMLPRRAGRALEYACTLFGLVAAAFITSVLVELALSSFAYDSRSATVLQFPLVVPQAVIGVGAALLTAQFAARLARLWIGVDPDDPPPDASFTSE